MPIHTIVCLDCGHVAKSLVLKGARMPSEWACSTCGGCRARPDLKCIPEPHPWEMVHGAGCLCCGSRTFWSVPHMMFCSPRTLALNVE